MSIKLSDSGKVIANNGIVSCQCCNIILPPPSDYPNIACPEIDLTEEQYLALSNGGTVEALITGSGGTDFNYFLEFQMGAFRHVGDVSWTENTTQTTQIFPTENNESVIAGNNGSGAFINSMDMDGEAQLLYNQPSNPEIDGQVFKTYLRVEPKNSFVIGLQVYLSNVSLKAKLCIGMSYAASALFIYEERTGVLFEVLWEFPIPRGWDFNTLPIYFTAGSVVAPAQPVNVEFTILENATPINVPFYTRYYNIAINAPFLSVETGDIQIALKFIPSAP